MTMTLKRRAVVVVTALLVALGPGLGLTPIAPAPTAEAFNPPLHIGMFTTVVGSYFSPEAQGWVAAGLEQSDNVEGQARPELHFDSAADPTAICDLWKRGSDSLLNEAARFAVEAFRRNVADPPESNRVAQFRQQALTAYGQYLHAQQDFYAHTNWIERRVAQRRMPDVAPIWSTCDVAKLPAGLQSGFFRFDITALTTDAPDFCGPIAGPRPPANSGFRQCHGPPHPDTMREIIAQLPAWVSGSIDWLAGRDVTVSTLDPTLMLAKDLFDLYHGSEELTLPDGRKTTYHREAVRLASEATAKAFLAFRDRTVEKLQTELPDRDPGCLFEALVKGGDPNCPKQPGCPPERKDCPPEPVEAVPASVSAARSRFHWG
jgi:hypothetical protein